ncbi:hypothetical protein H2203_003409 [Taxawa tesnikishii (nom. ined.)]|nr:hypothetical protein H2203_003409 [Dothideales sp. JES 119]
MASLLEATLISTGLKDQRITLTILNFVRSTGDLLTLRSVSKTLHKLLEPQIPSLLHTLYVCTPPTGSTSIRDLEAVSQHCRHLVIKIGFAPSRSTHLFRRDSGLWSTETLRGAPSAEHLISTALSPHRNLLVDAHIGGPLAGSPHWPDPGDHQDNRDSRSLPTPPRPSEVDATLLEEWTRILTLLTNIDTLTIACNGDPGWVGFTPIEALLVVLRISIERVNPSSLRTLRLSPIHAMGVLHFRWHGGAAYGEARGATDKSVWFGCSDVSSTSRYVPIMLDL